MTKEERQNYNRAYRNKHKEELDRKSKAYRLIYNKEHREEIRSRNRLWKEKNKDKCRISNTAYVKARIKIDPTFKLLRYARTRIYIALKRQLAGKELSTLNLTGCSTEDLKSHIEKQFKENMAWTNYGTWHVDHIKPCCKFDLSNRLEQQKCFHYSNLQPLWAKDNLEKRGK
jgi:hypothetical protein